MVKIHGKGDFKCIFLLLLCCQFFHTHSNFKAYPWYLSLVGQNPSEVLRQLKLRCPLGWALTENLWWGIYFKLVQVLDDLRWGPHGPLAAHCGLFSERPNSLLLTRLLSSSTQKQSFQVLFTLGLSVTSSSTTVGENAASLWLDYVYHDIPFVI